MIISGNTKILAHIGVPMESFKAPLIYNPWFEAQGIDSIVVPMGCEKEDFSTFLGMVLRLRNCQGAIITMPHKMTAVDLLDKASTAVQICGACNAVKRNIDGQLEGAMFDGEGFVRSAQQKGFEFNHACVLVAGSGGVGSAIAAALASQGISRLGLYDVNDAQVIKLKDNIQQHYPKLSIETGSNSPVGWDMVVNATPLGMQKNDPLPFSLTHLNANTFVAEVVMSQEQTPLIVEAKKRGCKTQVGVDMLFEQIPAYLAFFGFPTASAEELRRLASIQY